MRGAQRQLEHRQRPVPVFGAGPAGHDGLMDCITPSSHDITPLALLDEGVEDIDRKRDAGLARARLRHELAPLV